MKESIHKAQFIEKIRSTRSEWNAALAQVSEEQMLQPGACGEWSLKDVAAHLTWHEREMIQVVKMHALVGSDLWNLPLDQRNHAICMENKDRPLQDVLVETQQVFASLLQVLETLSEEDLHDPARFPGMPAIWKPWDLIAGNTYEHYLAHLPQVQALLKS